MKRLLKIAGVVLTLGLLTPVAAMAGTDNGTDSSGTAADTAARRGKTFARTGSLTAPKGKGSFRFGVSSSATQIEDLNPNTDWYKWTQPAPDGMGRSPFVGDGVKGYSKAIEDVDLLDDLNVDSYRFSIEWARVEPRRNQIDEAALDHYSDQIDALLARGIRPMIVIHHFANPVWADNPEDAGCANGPSDTNLCGLDHPQGGPLVVKEMAEHAKLLAERFGDRVDEWATVNEPMVYMLFSHAFGAGPPGKANLPTNFSTKFAPAIRQYINAHAAMYKAVKRYDRVDADGDGRASAIGLTASVKQYIAVRDGKISTEPRDIAARDRFRYFFELNFLNSLKNGSFDADFDGTADEAHPEWKGTMDWLGIQLYDRTGVTDPGGAAPSLPVIDVNVCGAAPCLPLLDPSYFVPAMGYESDPDGLYPVLKDFAARFPGVPLVVSESGIASESGKRRAEFTVRALQQIERVRAEGVDVRGYYHWSLMDNFEWLMGYSARFGLYRVDRTTMERIPTEAATVYSEIARTRSLTPAVRAAYGGSGPLTPEPGGDSTPAPSSPAATPAGTRKD
ncbi:glycoside hydrolase family 1 protein [Streptomyces sp. NPDC093094]|uniref:glycoside hydrolase family 1 protein n=1 Tax=Streptomyces sp. NPDC093094 TaxID=3366026 RepID=UPI0037F47365